MNDLRDVFNAVHRADSIVLLTHVNIDGDTVGSSFALASALRALGKRVTVAPGEVPPEYLQFLCDEYVLDTDEAFSLAIAVDCGDECRFADRMNLFTSAKETMCIDHHQTNSGFADINYVKPDASSTGEVVYEIIRELGQTVSPRQANQLYAAMLTDTGGFKYSNTTPESLSYCSELMRAGANAAQIAIEIFETQSMAKIQLMERALSSIEVTEDGRISSIVISKEDFDITGGRLEDCEGFSGIARSIAGVEAAISIIQTDKVKVSLRSKQLLDVSQVAKLFGGGGHIRASGFSLPGDTDVQKLKADVLFAMQEALNKI